MSIEMPLVWIGRIALVLAGALVMILGGVLIMFLVVNVLPPIWSLIIALLLIK